LVPCTEVSNTTNATKASARSNHPGGVNVVHADNSVFFIPDDIDLQIWRSRATISGNKQIEKHDETQ
jgi:hypothetical protein